MPNVGFIGRYEVVGHIKVRKDTVIGNGETMTFRGTGWCKSSSGELIVVNGVREVARFNPHRWDHVYFEEDLVAIEHKKDC